MQLVVLFNRKTAWRMRFRVDFICFFFQHFIGNQMEYVPTEYLLEIFQRRSRGLGLEAASEGHFPPWLFSFGFALLLLHKALFMLFFLSFFLLL
jgi:hypothetical protein